MSGGFEAMPKLSQVRFLATSPSVVHFTTSTFVNQYHLALVDVFVHLLSDWLNYFSFSFFNKKEKNINHKNYGQRPLRGTKGGQWSGGF